MRVCRYLLLVAALAAGLALVASAGARGDSAGRLLYVAPTGSDANPGTFKRPLRTIQQALDALRPGDTAYVRRGVYSETVDARRRGTRTANIALRAYPGERPVITGQFKITGAWFRVSGFVFRGGTAANPDDVAVYVSGGDDIWISANEITGSVSSGIFLGDEGPNSSDRVRILGNDIHDNGDDRNFDHGIYFGHGRHGLVANNLIRNNTAYGIQAYPDCDDTVFSGNTIVGNGRSGVIVGGNGELASERNNFVNNIVAFNDEIGIVAYWEGPTGEGNTAYTNLVFGNREGSVTGPALKSSRTIGGDPRFQSRFTGNFHLGAGSPAIDSARPEYALAIDRDGRRRPQGALPDLGAFERPR